jgi:hypothetical protein
LYKCHGVIDRLASVLHALLAARLTNGYQALSLALHQGRQATSPARPRARAPAILHRNGANRTTLVDDVSARAPADRVDGECPRRLGWVRHKGKLRQGAARAAMMHRRRPSPGPSPPRSNSAPGPARPCHDLAGNPAAHALAHARPLLISIMPSTSLPCGRKQASRGPGGTVSQGRGMM